MGIQDAIENSWIKMNISKIKRVRHCARDCGMRLQRCTRGYRHKFTKILSILKLSLGITVTTIGLFGEQIDVEPKVSDQLHISIKEGKKMGNYVYMHNMSFKHLSAMITLTCMHL